MTDPFVQTLRATLREHAGDVELPPDWENRTLRRGRRVRRRWRVVPVVAAAVLVGAVLYATDLAGLRQPPPAADLPPEIRQLPLGSPPSVPYAVGRTIVLGDRAVELPARYEALDALSLGGTDAGLVVQTWVRRDSQGPLVTLHVAADGTVTELDRSTSLSSVAVSPDGRSAVWAAESAGSAPVVKLADLASGQIIATRELRGESYLPEIYDFDGTVVLLTAFEDGETGPRYLRWEPAPDRLQPSDALPDDLEQISAISLAADTQLASDGAGQHYCLINVALSDPDQQRWELCEPGLRSWISPDGKHFARDVETRLPDFETLHTVDLRLEIRDLESGDVVAHHRVPRMPLWAAAWESKQALLVFVRKDGDRPTYLLRCAVAQQTCERVTAPNGDPITAIAS